MQFLIFDVTLFVILDENVSLLNDINLEASQSRRRGRPPKLSKTITIKNQCKYPFAIVKNYVQFFIILKFIEYIYI